MFLLPASEVCCLFTNQTVFDSNHILPILFRQRKTIVSSLITKLELMQTAGMDITLCNVFLFLFRGKIIKSCQRLESLAFGDLLKGTSAA